MQFFFLLQNLAACYLALGKTGASPGCKDQDTRFLGAWPVKHTNF